MTEGKTGNQLSEMITGEDVANMLQKWDMPERDNDQWTLRKALKIIGRRDISTQLKIYLATGK